MSRGPDIDAEWAQTVLRVLKQHGRAEEDAVALYASGPGQEAIERAHRLWLDWGEDDELWRQLEPVLEAVKE